MKKLIMFVAFLTLFCISVPVLALDAPNQTVITSSNTIPIESDLSFTLSDAIYTSAFGDMNLWVKFNFFEEQGGILLWELDSYTVGPSGIWYQDSDGDGYGNSADSLTSSA